MSQRDETLREDGQYYQRLAKEGRANAKRQELQQIRKDLVSRRINLKDAVLNTIYTVFFKEYPFYDDLEQHGILQENGISDYGRVLGERGSKRFESHRSLKGRHTGRRSHSRN